MPTVINWLLESHSLSRDFSFREVIHLKETGRKELQTVNSTNISEYWHYYGN